MGYKNTLLKKTKFPRFEPYITFFATALIVYLILSTGVVSKKYNLEAGEIAKVDIKAPRDVEDKIATQKKIEEELNHLQDVYTYNADVRKGAIDNIDKLFQVVEDINANTSVSPTVPTNPNENVTDIDAARLKAEKLKKLKEQSPIDKISLENYDVLLSLTSSQLKSLHDDLIECINNVYDKINIYEGKSEDIYNAQNEVTATFNNTAYSREVKDLATAIGHSQLKANYFLDHAKTEEARQSVIKSITPVIYKKDQTIIAEGQPVTEAQIQLLEDIGLLDNERSTQVYLYITLAILVCGILGLQWIYIKEKREDIYKDASVVALINILTILTVGLARLVVSINAYVIPFACAYILFTVLVDGKTALVFGVLNVILVSILVSFAPHIIMIAILNAVIVPMVLKRVQQRSDILYSSVIIGIINMVFTAVTGYFLTSDLTSILNKALLTGGASIISGILAIGILPILENVFDIVTDVKLLELSNPNNPLMKRLLLEAPGTYHHSVLVANLAEMAAEKVGANPIMARTLAYYHDVGKLERPYYFKENQIGINPHDGMSPALSAAIILSHVDDGIKLANKYNLPKVIIDVINEHHGDSTAKYFYITMKNNSENPEEVDEKDYKYSGRPPRTKESTIVMMADGVEAAVRSIQKPNKEKIENMVDNIIKTRLEEGMLKNSDLTFKDLEKIRESFLKVLSGIYHERIEYPKEKLEKDIKGKDIVEVEDEGDEKVKIYIKGSFNLKEKFKSKEKEK